jgi:hypothetical protein
MARVPRDPNRDDSIQEFIADTMKTAEGTAVFLAFIAFGVFQFCRLLEQILAAVVCLF